MTYAWLYQLEPCTHIRVFHLTHCAAMKLLYSKAVDGHVVSIVGYQLLMVSDMFYLSMNI
jgi:hypothetical protein